MIADDKTTGTDILRQALFARSRKGNFLATLARDLQIGLSSLDEFARGSANLSVEVKRQLARQLFPHAEYDPKTDRLRKVNKAEPRSLGVRPPPIDPATLPKFSGGLPQRGPQPLKPLKPMPEMPQPGWAE